MLFKQGYKVGLARRNRRYTWRGDHFRAGKAKKRKHAAAKFYRP